MLKLHDPEGEDASDVDNSFGDQGSESLDEEEEEDEDEELDSGVVAQDSEEEDDDGSEDEEEESPVQRRLGKKTL